MAPKVATPTLRISESEKVRGGSDSKDRVAIHAKAGGPLSDVSLGFGSHALIDGRNSGGGIAAPSEHIQQKQALRPRSCNQEC